MNRVSINIYQMKMDVVLSKNGTIKKVDVSAKINN